MIWIDTVVKGDHVYLTPVRLGVQAPPSPSLCVWESVFPAMWWRVIQDVPRTFFGGVVA